MIQDTMQSFVLKQVTYTYRAEGPTTDARKAEITPEPLPTSRHTRGLEATTAFIQVLASYFKILLHVKIH